MKDRSEYEELVSGREDKGGRGAWGGLGRKRNRRISSRQQGAIALTKIKGPVTLPTFKCLEGDKP